MWKSEEKRVKPLGTERSIRKVGIICGGKLATKGLIPKSRQAPMVLTFWERGFLARLNKLQALPNAECPSLNAAKQGKHAIIINFGARFINLAASRCFF